MFCRMNVFLALTSIASLYLSAVAYNRAPAEPREYSSRKPLLYKIELEKEDTKECYKNSICAEMVYDLYSFEYMKRIEQRGCHCPEGTECWFHVDVINCVSNPYCKIRKEYLSRKGESSFLFLCKEVTCENIHKNNIQEETIWNGTALFQNETDHINNETDHTNNETIQTNKGLANMTSLSRNKTSCFSEEETQFENVTAQYQNETVQAGDEPTPLTVKHLVWKIKIFIQKIKMFIVGMKQRIWKRRGRTCQLENKTPHLNSKATPSVASEMQYLANRTKELISRMRDFSLVAAKLLEKERNNTRVS